MPNRSYQKGYGFERRVRKMFEKEGYLVIRSSGSKFPDGVALKGDKGHFMTDIIIWEAKVNKYLSKEEKEEAKKIFEKTGIHLKVYYRKGKKLREYDVQ